jgi:hypothetical protein
VLERPLGAKLAYTFDGVLLVPYTIWSHGRLVGETDLGCAYRSGNFRAGPFFPTEFGKTLMEIIAEPRRLMARMAKIAHDQPIDPAADAEWLAYEAATDREYALELELRDPSGTVISTEDIGIRDRQLLEELYPIDELEFGDEPFDPELEALMDHDLDLMQEWQPGDDDDDGIFDEFDEHDDEPLSRYHVVVFFSEESAIP